MSSWQTEVYSLREIARAAGVPLERVVAAVGARGALLGHEEAVRLGRTLASEARAGSVGSHDNLPLAQPAAAGAPLFVTMLERAAPNKTKTVSLAVSSTVHAGFIAGVVFMTTLSLAPTAAVAPVEAQTPEPMRLVYLNTPGPGGGGGGGGLRQKAPAPKALREGRRPISSPVPVRRPPPVEPVVSPPNPPPPPLNSEPLPVLVAPVVSAPADDRNRIGVFEQSPAQADSHGRGEGGGAGTGQGVGLGSGDGPGIGPGSGGGTGGGPYRPGSGVNPPRLLKEVKADYTEEARRRGLEGEVVLEIVVKRDGAVGDVKLLRRLSGGLDERAIQAVRQWRFAPATLKGVPVDVLVEVGVEFRLR
jgi:TonB family protein